MAQDSFEQLLNAVKQAESQGKRFDEKGNLLTSPKGAQGEMQVMPKTAKSPGYGVAPAQDKSPDELARVGKDYLQAMLSKYGDTKKALIAYNWGPKNTDDWLASGADPKKLPAETQNYVQKVTGMVGGGKNASTPVSEPTESEKTMTKALGSGMSAQNLVKDAGPGYKAAMAMMFLSEDKPKTDDEDIWKEADAEQVAEEAPPSPLEGLDLGYKTPFAAMQPQEPQQIAHFATGGLAGAPKVGVKGTARDALDAVKAEYDKYNTAATGYNTALGTYKTEVYDPYKEQVTGYNTALDKYKAETYQPYVDTVTAYNAALDQYKQKQYQPYLEQVTNYNNALNAYKTSTYDPYLSEVEKYNTALGQYKTETYDPYSTALDKYNAALAEWNAGPRTTAFAQTAPTLAKTFDLTAPTAPAAFSGTVPTAPEAFAQTAPTAPTAFSVKAPTLAKTFDMTAPTAPTTTQADYDKMVAAAQMDVQQRQKALDVASNPEAYGLTINKLFSHGGAVHRADGSPMGGENADHLTPQEIERMAAAQGAAFMTPSSGRGRVAGPISQALASGEAYPAMARGVAETPYNVVGAPVDLATLAMRPFGYKEEKPVMGSDWIKEKMTKLGIRPGEEANPTLQGFRTAGELGASVVNPGPVAAKVGQAAEKGAAVLGKETARQMLRGINGEGVLAPFSPTVAMPIVRPSGGLFPTASVVKENGTWITEQPKSNLDVRWSPVLDNIVDNTAELGQQKTDALMEMFGQKLKSYYSKQAGGPNDPLRTAVFSGKVKFDEASELNDMFPKALIEAAKKKDVTALRLLEKKYDDMLGIHGSYFQRESDQTLRRDLGPEKTTQMIMEQMKNHPEVVSDDMLLRYARKDISEMNPQQMKAAADEIRAKIKENPERFSTVMEPNVERTLSPHTGEMVYESSTVAYPNQYPLAFVQQGTLPDLTVQMGIDKGQPLFDVKHPESFYGNKPLLGMGPDDLVEAAKQLDPKELSRMSFPEFVLRAHNDSLATQNILSRAPEVEKSIKAGKPMPKDLSNFGVQEFLPTLNNYRWMEITNPAATALQAKALGNSIAGYARNGSYGSLSMGKTAMDRGAVRLFALYDPSGTPVTHVEYITDKVKAVKPEKADKANTITQFFGNGPLTGNVTPENYVEQVSDLVNKLDVVDLPYSIKSLMRANGKFATGGSVERISGDNRRYL